jgi:hypothetical protein
MSVRTINGKRYRDVVLEAADVRAAQKHVSSQPPVSEATKRAVRNGTEQSRSRVVVIEAL